MSQKESSCRATKATPSARQTIGESRCWPIWFHRERLHCGYGLLLPVSRGMSIAHYNNRHHDNINERHILQAWYAKQGLQRQWATFSNASFWHFAEEWNFVHITSLHCWQSNGLVEKSVQTLKRLMHKAKPSGMDFYQSLLAYHTTPLYFL